MAVLLSVYAPVTLKADEPVDPMPEIREAVKPLCTVDYKEYEVRRMRPSMCEVSLPIHIATPENIWLRISVLD
jgi:hypothetical protein